MLQTLHRCVMNVVLCVTVGLNGRLWQKLHHDVGGGAQGLHGICGGRICISLPALVTDDLQLDIARCNCASTKCLAHMMCRPACPAGPTLCGITTPSGRATRSAPLQARFCLQRDCMQLQQPQPLGCEGYSLRARCRQMCSKETCHPWPEWTCSAWWAVSPLSPAASWKAAEPCPCCHCWASRVHNLAATASAGLRGAPPLLPPQVLGQKCCNPCCHCGTFSPCHLQQSCCQCQATAAAL